MKKRLIFAVLAAFLCAFHPLTSSAQGVIAYKKYGTKIKVPSTQLDSIATYTYEEGQGDENTDNDDFKEYNVGGVVFKMIKVQAGTFKMGSTTGDLDEQPVHSVTISKDYYIGETEVTQELWTAVMGNNPSYYTSDSQLPVEQVSWNDCQEFISKLNSLTGANFCLPTEAEWEFAARGGNKSLGYTYSGSNTIDDVAWYLENSGFETHVVKTKKSNELGIYDMSGNVDEWCSDWYGNYTSAAVTDPKGASSGSARVTRGGGAQLSDAACCRLTARFHYSPLLKFVCGLRLASHPQMPSAQGVIVYKKGGNIKVPFTELDSIATYTYEEGQDDDQDYADIKQYNVGGVVFNMIKVQAGTFKMGSTTGDSDEYPVHSVTISKDYYIGETEVTQELWTAVMGNNPSNFASDSQFPVENVSWGDCYEFIHKLNSLTGANFRLPTEAQWEFAARGGNKSGGYEYSGSNNIDDVAWYKSNSGGKTHVVKTKQPNELGIYDMCGNVMEWCSQWYSDSYSYASVTDPTGPATGSFMVRRGGGWSNDAYYCRCADRNRCNPSDSHNYLGLRLVSQ